MGMKFGRFLLWFFKPLYWLLFPYKVVGREHVPKESDGPVILCCNHQSYLDPVYLLMSQKRHIYFMAKAELMKGRLGHWFFANVMGVFPVKRGWDTGAIDTAVQLVKEGKMMGIFPEAPAPGRQAGPGKSGAALIVSRTGAMVLPVGIRTKNQKPRIFRKVTVTYGEPIPFEELHLDDPEHPDLRYASRLIMGRIAGLIGEQEERRTIRPERSNHCP